MIGDLKQLLKIKNISFAVWGKTIDDLSIFTEESIIKNFNKKYIFVSLNPSGSIEQKYGNFHNANGKHNDSKLMEAFSGTQMEWMLMTDISSIADPNSSNVFVTDEDILRFFQIINCFYETLPTIIVANKKAYSRIKNVMNDKNTVTPEIIYIFGYSGAANGAVVKYYLDNNLGPLDASINTKYAKVVRHQLGLDR